MHLVDIPNSTPRGGSRIGFVVSCALNNYYILSVSKQKCKGVMPLIETVRAQQIRLIAVITDPKNLGSLLQAPKICR